MDTSSRVIAVLVSTLDGSVIYERFWTRLSELERADLRAAAAATAAGLFAAGGSESGGGNGIIADGREAVGRHRSAVLVSRCEGSLLLHAAGTGPDHDELTLARALRSLGGVLKGTGAGTGSGGGGGGGGASAAVVAAAAAEKGGGGGGGGSGGLLATGGGGSALSESSALDGYGKLVMAVDDLVFEGILDVTSNFGAARAARLRGCEV